MKFLLFNQTTDTYELGGWHHFVSVHETFEEAQKALFKQHTQFAYSSIVSLDKLAIVFSIYERNQPQPF